MIGHQPNIYWKICWKYIAPFLITILLAVTLISKFVNKVQYSAYDFLTVGTGFLLRLSHQWQ